MSFRETDQPSTTNEVSDRDTTIGASARALDDASLGERIRLERGSVIKLLGLGVGYVLLVAMAGWLMQDPVASGSPWGVAGWLIPTVVILALAFQTMDAAAGMGFGTALTPLLLVMGYDPLAVVPVLLISQSAAGLVSAAVHHELRNVRFSFQSGSNQAIKLMLLIAGVGIVAIVGSVVLVYLAIDLPSSVIKAYVGILVLLMGLVAVVRRFRVQHAASYKPRRLTGFAALAGFNKGIGGGGYGPVVMLGAIYAGIYEKSAAAITSLAEALVSLAGIAAFIAIAAVGVKIDYTLLPSILAGSLLGAGLSPYLVRVLPNRIFSYIIPLYAAGIAIVILVQLFLSSGGG